MHSPGGPPGLSLKLAAWLSAQASWKLLLLFPKPRETQKSPEDLVLNKDNTNGLLIDTISKASKHSCFYLPHIEWNSENH